MTKWTDYHGDVEGGSFHTVLLEGAHTSSQFFETGIEDLEVDVTETC
jgi:hypothetical protein